jgi:hypothetical protein
MTPFEAACLIFSGDNDDRDENDWPDESPIEILIDGRLCPPDVVWPVFMASIAHLSGWLDDATTPEGVLEAATHGKSLLGAGLVDEQELHTLARDVMAELRAKGELDERAMRGKSRQTTPTGVARDAWGMRYRSLN